MFLAASSNSGICFAMASYRREEGDRDGNLTFAEACSSGVFVYVCKSAELFFALNNGFGYKLVLASLAF